MLYGAANDDNAGIELLLADFTLDGTEDLIIAAPFGNTKGQCSNRAYIVSCPPDATREQGIPLATDYTFLLENIPYQGYSNLNNTGLAFGQLTGANGIPDVTPCLVLGVKGSTLGGATLTGTVLGVSGRTESASMASDSRRIDVTVDDATFKIHGSYGGAKAGEVVRVFDVNNDTNSDLLIGCPGAGYYESATGTSDSSYPPGMVYVIYGPIPATAEFSLDELGAAGPMSFLNYEEFIGVGGYDIGCVTVTVNAQTETVLAIAKPVANSTPEELSFAGKVNVFYSSSIQGSTTWDTSVKSPDAIVSGAKQGDELGRALVFGEIFSGTTLAVVAGASFADSEVDGESGPRYEAGMVYVFPITLLSPTGGDLNVDRQVDYKDLFELSRFWRGIVPWLTLSQWHESGK